MKFIKHTKTLEEAKEYADELFTNFLEINKFDISQSDKDLRIILKRKGIKIIKVIDSKTNKITYTISKKKITLIEIKITPSESYTTVEVERK